MFTFTARSTEKMTRQAISMISVRPQGGSHGGERCLGSDETDKEDGRSTKASNSTSAMVRPKPLRNRKMMSG